MWPEPIPKFERGFKMINCRIMVHNPETGGKKTAQTFATGEKEFPPAFDVVKGIVADTPKKTLATIAEIRFYVTETPKKLG